MVIEIHSIPKHTFFPASNGMFALLETHTHNINAGMEEDIMYLSDCLTVE